MWYRLPGWLDGAHPTVEDGKVKRTTAALVIALLVANPQTRFL